MIFAIDPGSVRSGWVKFDGVKPVAYGRDSNEELIEQLRLGRLIADCATTVIEWVQPRGMLGSEQLFETLWWAGRFGEAAFRWTEVDRITRYEIKTRLVGGGRVSDSNVRAALIDRYGGIEGKTKAVGTKKAPGPLYGISNDVWAALAVAVAYTEQKEQSLGL